MTGKKCVFAIWVTGMRGTKAMDLTRKQPSENFPFSYIFTHTYPTCDIATVQEFSVGRLGVHCYTNFLAFSSHNSYIFQVRIERCFTFAFQSQTIHLISCRE